MKELNLPEKCEHGLIDKKGIYNDIFPLIVSDATVKK